MAEYIKVNSLAFSIHIQYMMKFLSFLVLKDTIKKTECDWNGYVREFNGEYTNTRGRSAASRKSKKKTKYSYRLINYDSVRQTILVHNKSLNYSKLCSFFD